MYFLQAIKLEVKKDNKEGEKNSVAIARQDLVAVIYKEEEQDLCGDTNGSRNLIKKKMRNWGTEKM